MCCKSHKNPHWIHLSSGRRINVLLYLCVCDSHSISRLCCWIAIRSFHFPLGCLLILRAHSLGGFSVCFQPCHFGFIVWNFWNGSFSELLVQHKTLEELNRGGEQGRRASLSPWPILQYIKHQIIHSFSVFFPLRHTHARTHARLVLNSSLGIRPGNMDYRPLTFGTDIF